MKNSLWPILGGIRFLLALIVVSVHFIPYAVAGPIGRQLSVFSGMTAVVCFFVISGFSIAASYEREKEGFFFRRLLRVVPLYAPIVLASFAVSRIPNAPEYIHPATSGQAIGNLLFLQGFVCNYIPTDGAVWSISIEVFFYMLAPLFARMGNRYLFLIIGVSAVAFVAFGKLTAAPMPSFCYGVNVLLLAWAWILGFVAYRYRESKNLGLTLMLFGLCVISQNHDFSRSFSWPITWAITCTAIAMGSRIKISPNAERILSTLGDVSYPLYLIHLPLFMFLSTFFTFKSEVPYFAFAIGLAYVLDRMYDKPVKSSILAIIRRFKAPGTSTQQARSLPIEAHPISASGA